MAIASREVLLQLINEWYGSEPIYLRIKDDDDDFFAEGELHELHEFISNLDPKNYALVAIES